MTFKNVDFHDLKEKVKQNWKAGFTVSLVSIPLSLALAIASGATPTQGITTAFWAGLLSAFLGGSHYNVTGPTGALSGILVSFTLVYGYQVLPLVAILSGFLILLCYFFNLDKYIIFIPRSVVHGFTLGIAFIIGFGQLDNALGLTNIPKTENFLKNILISLGHIKEMQIMVFLIFLFGVLFIYFWNKKYPKMPGAIIVAFGAIFMVMLSKYFNFDLPILTLGDKYPEVTSSFFHLSIFDFSLSMLLKKEIWAISIATTIIAILETLLSGQIADVMTKTKFNRSKEVFGLAIANIGSGLMGGIPATAALARTALNIKSGANHKTSGALNSFFILIISLFLLNYFKLLPMAVIASILVIVAIGMVEKHHFIHLMENEKIAFYLSMLVAILVIGEDPIIGILVGTVIALMIFVNKMSYGQTEVLIWKNNKMMDAVLKNDFVKQEVIDSDIIVYKISGTLTYINMPAHLEAIQKIKHNKYVIVSLRHAFYADIDGIDYLEEIVEVLKNNNDKILLSGVNKEIQKLIQNKDFYKQKLVEGKIYKRTSEAIDEILKQ
jgi:SulP family sulfate permease